MSRLEELIAAASSRADARTPKAIARLHELFTDQRGQRARNYLDNRDLSEAYAAFYAPRNAAKVAILLEELGYAGRELRVLDLGAGPWVGLLGAAAVAELKSSVAIDRSGSALARGVSIADDLGWSLDARSITGDLRREFGVEDDRFDVVVLANVLNEIGDPRRGVDQRVRLLRRAHTQLAPGGVVLVVEPGTRNAGRALMRVRDVLAHDGVTISAPCAGASRCPLLSRGADWCHAERPAPNVKAAVTLAKKARIDGRLLKFSYLALGASVGAGHRLVGGPMREDQLRYACTNVGLVELKRPRGGPLPDEVLSPPRGALVATLPSGVSASPASDRPARRPRGPKGVRAKGGAGGRPPRGGPKGRGRR